MAQAVKNLQCRRLEFNPWVGKVPWRKEWPPTTINTLAWRTPRTEEPGRPQSTGSQRVGHDYAASTQLHSSRSQKSTIKVLEGPVLYGGFRRESVYLPFLASRGCLHS